MKKFLAGSAIATIFTTDDELIAISNTQINDTINLSVESQEVRSGQGNALDYIYYHSSRMEGSLEDAQFNLDYIRYNIGAKQDESAQVYKSISHKLVAGENTIKISGLIGKNVWVYHNDEAATFEVTEYEDGVAKFNNNKSDGSKSDKWKDIDVCIKYLAEDSGNHIKNLTINANMIPSVVKIVLEAQLFASETGAQDSSRIGTVQFVIPRAQLSGTQEISLSSSGVASTPLSYLALKSDDLAAAAANACAGATGIYGYITQILETTEWYEGVKALAIDAVEDGLTIEVGQGINTYAISANSAAYIVKPADRLTYGYQTDTQTTTKWVESTEDEAFVTKSGVIKSADVKKVFVKVAGVDSIVGDSAEITVI